MVAAFFLWVIFLLLEIFLKTTNANATSGPYKVILDRIANCEDKGTGEMSVKSTAKKGDDGEVYHSGELNMPYGLSDNLKAVGDAYIKNEANKYVPMGLIYKLNMRSACSNLKQMAEMWFDILIAAGNPSPTCPIAKGKQHFKNYHVGPKLKNINELKYGKYRVRLHFTRNGRKIGSICYFATVVPSNA